MGKNQLIGYILTCASIIILTVGCFLSVDATRAGVTVGIVETMFFTGTWMFWSKI